MFNSSYLFICLTTLFLSSGYSKENLSFKTYLTSRLKNDPVFQKISVDKYKPRYLVEKSLPSSKLSLILESEKSIANSVDSQKSEEITASLSKDFITTGTNLSVSHTKVLNTEEDSRESAIQLEQSIYKNSFGKSTRRLKKSLLIQQDIDEMNYLENVENYILTSVNEFLSLSKSFNDYKLSEKIYHEALKLNKNVRKKYKSKVSSKTDLKKSQLLVLLEKENLLTKKSLFLKMKQNLLQIIKLSFDEINPKEVSLLIEKLENHHGLKRVSDSKSLRTYRINELQNEVAKANTLIARDDLNPDVNILVKYNQDNSTKYSNVTKQNETIVGISVEIPIADSKTQSEFSLAKLNEMQVKSESKAYINLMDNHHNTVYMNLTNLKEQLKIEQEKVSLMQSILTEELKRYNIGKISLEQVLDQTKDFATYRNQLEQTKVSYISSLVEWLALNDQLLPVFKDELPL